MVKYKSYTDVKRNIAEYKMRTSYAGLVPINRLASNLDSVHSSRQTTRREQTLKKSKSAEVVPQPQPQQNVQTDATSQQQVHIETQQPTIQTSTKKSSCCTIM